MVHHWYDNYYARFIMERKQFQNYHIMRNAAKGPLTLLTFSVNDVQSQRNIFHLQCKILLPVVTLFSSVQFKADVIILCYKRQNRCDITRSAIFYCRVKQMNFLKRIISLKRFNIATSRNSNK